MDPEDRSPLRLRPGGELGRRLDVPPPSAARRRADLRWRIAGETVVAAAIGGTLLLFLVFAQKPRATRPARGGTFPAPAGSEPPFAGGGSGSTFFDELDRLRADLGDAEAAQAAAQRAILPARRADALALAARLESAAAALADSALAIRARVNAGEYGDPTELRTRDRALRTWEAALSTHQAAMERAARSLGIALDGPRPVGLDHGLDEVFDAHMALPRNLDWFLLAPSGAEGVEAAVAAALRGFERPLERFRAFAESLP